MNLNYVIITDYQFFPMLLNLKQISPAKWYDAMSVPNKKIYIISNLKIILKQI